jgi:hypothetical protein
MRRVLKSQIQINKRSLKLPQPFIMNGQICWGHFNTDLSTHFNKQNSKHKKTTQWLH